MAFTSKPHIGKGFPAFIVEATPDASNTAQTVRITCPRGDCGAWFIVSAAWLHKHAGRGRSCPHCMRASLVPEETS